MTFDMIQLSDRELSDCERLVNLALQEDLGTLDDGGDITSLAMVPAELEGNSLIVARSNGVLAGMQTARLVVEQVDFCVSSFESPEPPQNVQDVSLLATPRLSLQPLKHDGSTLHQGDHIARLVGPARRILAAERTMLNFLQHLSGIATLTWRYVQAIAGLPCRIFDTRKTLPAWRLLQKYAVRCGGGYNHRMGLCEGILIKDNHLAAIGGGPEAIRKAIHAAREKVGHSLPVEVEVANLEELETAVAGIPDIILLDNMPIEVLREAVLRRNDKAPKILLEASGGVTLANVRAIAETGVDRISVGALTHSAPALDIALDFIKE